MPTFCDGAMLYLDSPIDLGGGVEILLDQLFASGLAVAATHDRTQDRLFSASPFHDLGNDSVTGSKIEGQTFEGIGGRGLQVCPP
jgi:hypothetical protein